MPVGFAADIVADETGGGADRFGDPLALLGEDIGQYHPGAESGEQPRFGLTLSARCAGDDRDLAGQIHQLCVRHRYFSFWSMPVSRISDIRRGNSVTLAMATI